MPSRRQIREAVVQFLYGFDLEGGADPSPLREPFWQFVTESDRRALQLAIWKTLHHLNLGRETRHAELQERLPPALEALRADPDAGALAESLALIARLEADWTRQFRHLERLPRDQPGETLVASFSEGFEALFSTDRRLSASRAEFLRLLEDFPAHRAIVEPVAGSLHRLERISARMRTLEDPETFPDRPELTRIRRSRADLRELRAAADRIIDAVLANKEALDRALEGVVENFVPERIDPIDRAILRLATWEILHDPDVPKPVAINEAIEIARKFGTTDSARFVNGILDQIGRPDPPVATGG